MFDSQPQNPNQSSPNQFVPPSPPPVEDMLKETDTGQAARPLRPVLSNQPPQAPMSQVPIMNDQFTGDLFGGRSLGQNKALIALLAIVVAVILGGGVWAFNYFLKSKPTGNSNANQEANINQPVNANQNANQNVNAGEENANTAVTPQDSDSDGLSDDEERQVGSDPNNFDSDLDGLTDKMEVNVFKTNPLNPDTDGDGFPDGREVINGYDPAKPGSARLYETPKS